MKISLLFIFSCLFGTALFAQKTDTLTTISGIKYFYLKKGAGPVLTPGWIAIWQYRLTLTDGTKIDASWDRNSPFAAKYPSGQIIKGVTEALSLMHLGDSAVFIIPSSLCYGEKGSGSIPPNATLVFDMKLIETKENSLQEILDSALFERPVTNNSKPRMKEVMAVYTELKNQHFKNLYTSEDDFNNLGYQILKNFPEDAVEFFKMNIEIYPKSWNVYDSLGEGYEALGKTGLAIENYEKSVKLNPDNTNGIEMIKKLKAKISASM